MIRASGRQVRPNTRKLAGSNGAGGDEPSRQEYTCAVARYMSTIVMIVQQQSEQVSAE